MKSKIPRYGALATCLCLGLFIWFLMMTSNSITLANVQNSIKAKTWILLQFEDGKNEWHNLVEKKSFAAATDRNDRNFYAFMIDHVSGIKRHYHANWGEQIHESTITPYPLPESPWEYVTNNWDRKAAGKDIQHKVEKIKDTIEGRSVIRFDTYDIGPLGIRVLAQQVWADPKTRLPIRVRENLGWKNRNYVNKFRTGDFSFPEEGPSTIFDLGAPKELKVVCNWGVIEPQALAVIEGAKKAQRQFPNQIRIVTKSKFRLTIYYRYRNLFRKEIYVRKNNEMDKNIDVLPLEIPVSNEWIHRWAQANLTLVEKTIFDGRYEYSCDAHARLREGSDRSRISMHVEQSNNDEWTHLLLPIREQWSYTTNVGPMRVVKNEEGVLPGCVLLQYEGINVKRDWYIDPNRDYICVEKIEYTKNENGKWEKKWDAIEWTDLTSLSTGQWYAKTDNLWEKKRQFDVTLLSDAECKLLFGGKENKDFFDGEKMLKSALENGTKITFWAR